MNKTERIALERLVKQYDCEETTDIVRRLKHSSKIRKDIDDLLKLKANVSEEEYKNTAHITASFLYDNYTNFTHMLMILTVKA